MTNTILKLHDIKTIDKYFAIDWAEASHQMRENGSIAACNYLRKCPFTENVWRFLMESPYEVPVATWSTITSEYEFGFNVRVICDLLLDEELAILLKLSME